MPIRLVVGFLKLRQLLRLVLVVVSGAYDFLPQKEITFAIALVLVASSVFDNYEHMLRR
jgi:hypothetical protein